LRVNFRLPNFPVPEGGPPLDAAPVEAIPLPPAEAPLDAPEAPPVVLDPEVAAEPLAEATPVEDGVVPDESPDPLPEALAICEPVAPFAGPPVCGVVLPHPTDHARNPVMVAMVAHVDRAMANPS